MWRVSILGLESNLWVCSKGKSQNERQQKCCLFLCGGNIWQKEKANIQKIGLEKI